MGFYAGGLILHGAVSIAVRVGDAPLDVRGYPLITYTIYVLQMALSAAALGCFGTWFARQISQDASNTPFLEWLGLCLILAGMVTIVPLLAVEAYAHAPERRWEQPRGGRGGGDADDESKALLGEQSINASQHYNHGGYHAEHYVQR